MLTTNAKTYNVNFLLLHSFINPLETFFVAQSLVIFLALILCFRRRKAFSSQFWHFDIRVKLKRISKLSNEMNNKHNIKMITLNGVGAFGGRYLCSTFSFLRGM